MNRYHLIISATRTTVTMDRMLSNLLAVKLNADPFEDPQAAHSAVRLWLQSEIDRDPGAFVLAGRTVTNGNSQRLQMLALRAVAAANLLRHLDDCEANCDAPKSRTGRQPAGRRRST
jgi:hypothetical protein